VASRQKILVVSAGSATAVELSARLNAQQYQVVAARSGAGLIRALRQMRPHLVVVDSIDARPDAAQLEVALLKDQCPGVPIIALSAVSTETDGAVIEQGIFCYLGGASLEELVRVIEVACRERQTPAAMNAERLSNPRSVT
jgi:DNA-binding response OmpR family regulator